MNTVEEQQLADRDRAVRAAMLAVDTFLIDNADAMDRCTRAAASRITAEAVLGYLIGEGLIEVKTEWPEWLSVVIAEHLRPDIDGRLREAQALRNWLDGTRR